jgi:hypothetical protein
LSSKLLELLLPLLLLLLLLLLLTLLVLQLLLWFKVNVKSALLDADDAEAAVVIKVLVVVHANASVSDVKFDVAVVDAVALCCIVVVDVVD